MSDLTSPRVRAPLDQLIRGPPRLHRNEPLVYIRLLPLLAVLISTVSIIGDVPTADAHVRYILTEEEIATIAEGRPPPATLVQGDILGFVMLVGFLAVVVVQYAGLILATRPFAKRTEDTLLSLDDYVPLLLRVLVGIFLVLSGATGQLFTPQPGITFADLATAVSILQLASGVLLITGFLTKIGALILALLVATSFAVLGVHGLDQFVLLGLAVLLFFEGGLRHSLDSFTVARIQPLKRIGALLGTFKPYSMPGLRITLGITLIWLGLTEKLLAPELTAAAIGKYNVPFFPELSLFVFLFGFFEILLGAHYLLGIFNRLISLLYLGLLAAAFFLFGEGPNHLHLFAVALAFLIRGAGPYRMHVVLKTELFGR